MIISRAPVRICLAGGGTDLAAYYEEFSGLTISAAIDKYVYTVSKPADEWQIISADYQEVLCRLKDGAPDSEHLRLVHEVIRYAQTIEDFPMPREIFTASQVIPGTGLGSSGAAAVSVLKALIPYLYGHLLADHAYYVEAEVLDAPVGKQDQHIASFGAIRRLEYGRDGQVWNYSMGISGETFDTLERRLLLFFTGMTRASKTLLVAQRQKMERRDPSMMDALHKVKNLAEDMYTALWKGDCDLVGRLLHRGWALKRRFGPVSTDEIDHAYEYALANGALGGKLPGAGGGGYLLLYCEEGAQQDIRFGMQQWFGFRELLFKFDLEGAKIILEDENV
jgi:D-glycero-alpha-D-manno-heptose-7-phosphate kinase